MSNEGEGKVAGERGINIVTTFYTAPSELLASVQRPDTGKETARHRALFHTAVITGVTTFYTAPSELLAGAQRPATGKKGVPPP